MTMNTMTMTDTITSGSVTMQPPVLASINSLAVYAAGKTEAAPILQNIHVTRTGDTQLTAVTTNRYVAVKAVYDNVEFTDWDDDTSMLIPVDILKQAAAVSKANRGLAMVMFRSITFAADPSNNAYVSVGETQFPYHQATGSYPPVAKLFPDTEPNGAATLGINPKWLAALSKIVVPEVRPAKDTPWQLAFWSEESAKPKPMQASMIGSDYDIRVLIQPNLIVR
jgi:DNA polymerase III sliding clamp (beta) subunit (PCNA family)